MKQHAGPEGVLAYFGRLLPAIGLVVAMHLLWADTDVPGGAFQAGTVLAAVWLLTVMAGVSDVPPVSNTALRVLLVIGPGGFLLFGRAGALAGVFLQYPPDAARAAIIATEARVGACGAGGIMVRIAARAASVPAEAGGRLFDGRAARVSVSDLFLIFPPPAAAISRTR